MTAFNFKEYFITIKITLHLDIQKGNLYEILHIGFLIISK